MGTQRTPCVRESPGWHMALPCLPHIDPVLCSIPGERAASSTAPERIFHLKTRHAALRRATRSSKNCSYFSFSVLNFHTGFLITALQLWNARKTPLVTAINISSVTLTWNRWLHHSHSAETTMHPYNCSIYPTDSYKFLENNCKKNWVCSLRRKSAWQKSSFMLHWLPLSGLNQNLLLPNSEMPIGQGHLHPPPSSFQVFCQPLEQHSSASDSARAAWFGTFLLPTGILEIPPQLQLKRALGRSARVCDLLGEGEKQTQWLYLSVKRSENTKVAISGCPWLEI